jgi:hypothetical protein
MDNAVAVADRDCSRNGYAFKGRKMELLEKKLVYFIGLVVLLELISTFANIFGRFNLSKTLLTSGFF